VNKSMNFTGGSTNPKGMASGKKDSGEPVSEETRKNSTNGCEHPSEWVGKPDNAKVIDDCFYVKNQRWGTYVSVHKTGELLVTSSTEEQCISSTRWYLKAKQEGFPAGGSGYTGTVGGKL